MDLKPLSVAVLDAGGHVIAFEREDAAASGQFAIAHGKAYGLAGGHRPDAAGRDAGLFHGRGERVYGGQVVPVPGGVLLRDRKGALIGAVGVTGDTSDNDAAAAMAGIEAAGLTGET